MDSYLRFIFEKAPAFGKKVAEGVTAVVANIRNEIGREMTLDQIREKLAGGGGSNGANASPVGDAVITQELDGLVDNFLND